MMKSGGRSASCTRLEHGAVETALYACGIILPIGQQGVKTPDSMTSNRTEPSTLPWLFYHMIILLSHFHYQKRTLILALQSLNQPASQPSPITSAVFTVGELGHDGGISIICWPPSACAQRLDSNNRWHRARKHFICRVILYCLSISILIIPILLKIILTKNRGRS